MGKEEKYTEVSLTSLKSNRMNNLFFLRRNCAIHPWTNKINAVSE